MPSSWAARPESDLAIWTIRMQPNAQWTMPAAKPGTNRTLYLFAGKARIGGKDLTPPTGIALVPDAEAPIVAGPEPDRPRLDPDVTRRGERRLGLAATGRVVAVGQEHDPFLGIVGE